MIKTPKIKKLFKRFKPEYIRAYLTVPRNWLYIICLAIFLLSLYVLAFNQLPQANNTIELSNRESGSLASITITGSEFKIELKDIYSDIDESVFNDSAKANQYIEAISYKAKKKNINTVNNKKVAINNINTNIVYVDDSNLEFNKADIELKKQDKDKEINTILYCEDNDFNKKTGQCGNWLISDIKPENKEDYISFTAYHFSAYVGAYLEIIDVQSNLTKGDIWEVRFQTEGEDTLEIEAVDGTLFGIDIEFINITCGETEIANENIVWEGQKLIVENYTCDNEISRIRNQTITGGRHWLSFSFGYTQGALAHNFACDSGDLDTDCYVDTQQYLGDGDEISGTGNLIVQSSGDLTASSSATSGTTYGNSFGIDMGGDITVQSGGTISGNVTATATEIDVQSGGTINVDYKGYTKSEGPGAGDASSGAGHGGTGGIGLNCSVAGSVYGSTTAPTDLGSGGGIYDSNASGLGGGAIKLTITGTTTINGTISANGQNSSNWGAGGSGGSVWITTDTLAGNGTTTVNGGNGCSTVYGGAGGGRIATYYTTDNSSVIYQAYGGKNGAATDRMGGAGTIYKKSSAQNYGDLVIDNNDQDYEDGTTIGKTPIDFSINLNTLTVQNYGLLVAEAGSNITYNTINWDNQAIIEDYGGTFTMFDGSQDVTIAATSRLYTKTARNCNSLTVNGKLSHMKNSSAETYKIDITAANDITINSGATISLTDRGYTGGYGSGAGTDEGTYGSGAGHGGHGGATLDASSSGGPTYDSTTTPINIGSGGGDDGGVTGGPSGGGAIKLTAGGTTTINANISANGNNASNTNGGGASGGSIYIICDTLAGTAALSANGGNPQTANAGGGGGGRIALDFNTYNATLTFSVDGGGTTYPGADGTIYPDANPTISTLDATSIQMTSATGNGSVDALGINSITEHGHVWGTSSDLAILTMETPISQWKMNDNAADTTVIDSVGSNNGTALQNTSILASTTAKINGALEFNGSSDYISLPSSISSSIGDNITISAWVYSNALSQDSVWRGVVTEAFTGDGNVEFELFLNGADDNLSAGFYNGSWHQVSDASAFPLNQWVHVAATYDGHYIRVYRDSQEVKTSSDLSLSLPSGTNGWRIGRRHDNGAASDLWNGYIDDVRIYDYALTTNEISQIYNSGNGTELATTSLYSELGAKSSTGAFESPLTGLTLDTTYYIRSYATLSDSSTIYGNEVQFDTLAEPIHKYRFNPGGYYNFKGYFKFK